MDFILALIDNLFGWVGLAMAGTVGGYLWLNHQGGQNRGGSQDYVSKMSEKLKEEEAKERAKEELLDSIRSGQYGEALQRSVSEIEKDLRKEGKRTVKYEEALYLSRVYGSRINVSEEGEFIIRSEPVTIEQENTGRISPRGWRSANAYETFASSPQPHANLPETPTNIQHMTAPSENLKPDLQLDGHLVAEAELKAKLMSEPWFKYCEYFNGSTEGPEWKPHPTFMLSRYKELDEGGIRIVTPYAYEVLENNKLLEYKTWETMMEEETEEAKGSVKAASKALGFDKGRKPEAPVKRPTVSKPVASVPVHDEPNAKQEERELPKPLSVKSYQEYVQKVNADSMNIDTRRAIADTMLEAVYGLIEQESTGRYFYSNEGHSYLAMETEEIVKVLGRSIAPEARGEFADFFLLNGSLFNDFITEALDVFNRFFCMHNGYDLSNKKMMLFDISIS